MKWLKWTGIALDGKFSPDARRAKYNPLPDDVKWVWKKIH